MHEHEITTVLYLFYRVGSQHRTGSVTKHLAVVHLKGQKPFVLIKGVFEFYYSENRGAAFGMLQGRQGFFFLIAAAVILAVLWAVYRMPAGKRYLPLMMQLVSARIRRSWQYDRPSDTEICGGFPVF